MTTIPALRERALPIKKRPMQVSGNLLSILFFCFLSMHAFSQSNLMDSLKNGLPRMNGKDRADRLNEIGKEYRDPNHDSARHYALAAFALSEKLAYPLGMGEANRTLGWLEQNPEKAKAFFYQALSQFNSIQNKKGIADTYNNLGSLYREINDPLALVCYDSSLMLYRDIGFKKGEAAVLNYIGIVYQKIGNFQKAIDYTLQGLDVRKTTNDHPGVIYSLINAGNLYLEGGQMETALKFYNESITYAGQHNFRPNALAIKKLAETYLRLRDFDKAEAYLLHPVFPGDIPEKNPLLLGQLYMETNRPDSALKMFRQSLSWAKERQDNEEIAASLIGLSRVYLKEKNRKSAMDYSLQAFAKSDSIKNKRYVAEAALILSNIYESDQNYSKAFSLYKRAHSILDSIANETNEGYQHKLAFFESKSEIENQQARVKILSGEKALQEQKLNTERLYKELILAGAAIILLISFFSIRYINQKRKKIQSQRDEIDLQKLSVEKAYEELKATQSQLLQREKMASLGELMAGIAHEIQNPLNFVNNFSEVNEELMGEMNEAFEKQDVETAKSIARDMKKNIEKVIHHGRRADGIVKGMLQHSRSGTGQKEPSDINALTDEYLRLSYHGARAKDKSFKAIIHTHFDPSIGMIDIIPPEIGRVLLNLFNNAFYAVSEKKRQKDGEFEPAVTVSTRNLIDSLEIRVRDNGPGVSQKILNKIYQPFFTTKPTGEGTGLGLSLSYDIITQMHGGELHVETKEDEYAEFIIWLPK